MDKLQQTPEASLDRLMQEYGTRVLRLVTLMVKDRDLAEDITQDVFLKVYRNLSGFRGESSIHTWIYRIAVNECKGYLRSWTFRNLFPQAWIQKMAKRRPKISCCSELPGMSWSGLSCCFRHSIARR